MPIKRDLRRIMVAVVLDVGGVRFGLGGLCCGGKTKRGIFL